MFAFFTIVLQLSGRKAHNTCACSYISPYMAFPVGVVFSTSWDIIRYCLYDYIIWSTALLLYLFPPQSSFVDSSLMITWGPEIKEKHISNLMWFLTFEGQIQEGIKNNPSVKIFELLTTWVLSKCFRVFFFFNLF